jgi:ABC-type branched-subunit amino acid transport system ATPase component
LSSLIVEKVTAGYTRLPVINEVSLRVEGGTIVSVIGANGSGKSTLLKAIAGILRPTAGQILVDEDEITRWPAFRRARRGVAYVPQIGNIFPSLRVVENLEMGAFGENGKQLRDKVDGLLSGLPELAAARRKRAGNLSGGQRNLLGVACALIAGPQFLLADEPTAGLAPANARRIWSYFVDIAAQGVGVVVVEQNVDMALEHSSWSYVLANGRNSVSGPAPVVRQANLREIFLGASGDAGGPRSQWG